MHPFQLRTPSKKCPSLDTFLLAVLSRNVVNEVFDSA